MTPFSCFTKFLLLLFIISAVPIALLISLERAKTTTHVYQYHSAGWFRECAKWDNASRRFIVSFVEGGLGQIPIPGDHSPSSVLEEIPILKDVDLGRNASLGITIDRPRNRLMVAIGDAFGYRYSGLAAYDLNSWKRLFLTHLSEFGDERTYAEDVAVDPDGNAYVTDIKGGRIWKVGVNGEFLSVIRSPLFTSKGWGKSFFTLNGIVYHPNGYLLIVHTMNGNLFKIEIEKDNEIKVVKVNGGPLSYGDGIELLSPTKLVVAGCPSTKLVESTDDWVSASVVGQFQGPRYRLPTAATVKDGKVYVSHLLGIGYPRKKHVLVEAVFTS